jgi:hypothetical protein
VKQLEHLGCAPLCSVWERHPHVIPRKACLTQLIHLGEERQPAHKPLSCHLTERAEVDVAKSGVPTPCIFTGDRAQIDWACDVDVEHIQSPRTAVYLGQETHVFIMNAHHASLDQDLVANLIQLAAANDISSEARDEVHITKGSVFSILAGEKDCSAALNPHDGAVTEPHCATHIEVEVAEGLASASHVV